MCWFTTSKIHLLNNLHKNNIKCIILTGGNDVIERNNYNFSREKEIILN